MFELNVHAEFCAAHALSIAGTRERTHGHNFRVTVAIAGDQLDGDGLLCDFHTVESKLTEVIEPFQNADLNESSPFSRVNPSAENIARHIAERLSELLDPALAPYARVAAVTITEAPGCAATYRPPAKPARQ